MKKQVSILSELSQKKSVNGELISFDGMTKKELFEHCPAFDSPSINTVMDNDRIAHCFIAIYENLEGETKRRIVGFPDKSESTEDLKSLASLVTDSLGINIDRTLERVK